MDNCPICGNNVTENEEIVKLREKGAKRINEFSKLKNVNIQVTDGQIVHKACRRNFTNFKSYEIEIKKGTVSEGHERQPVLRSKSEKFNFKDNCLFCGLSAKFGNSGVFPVRTFDFQTKIERACESRKDTWAGEVQSRIEKALDLHAADCIYHQQCSVNFRTGKHKPSKSEFMSPKSKKNSGRPRDEAGEEAFKRIIQLIDDNDEEQYSIPSLVQKMKEMCGDAAYTSAYMKKRIEEYFGDSVIIAEVNGKSNVFTLHKTASSILHDFYHQARTNNEESEKNRIIKAAANLIKADICLVDDPKTHYVSPSTLRSSETNFEYVPESLRLFLQNLITSGETTLKISSIGQAVMQSTRPRSIIAPLQIGLGIQLHHHFGSKFLIDTLYSLGFSSSYSEVQKYEVNAAYTTAKESTQKDAVNGKTSVQFVADNVDHNIRTLDGHGTFHGMGIIVGFTPKQQKELIIPRVEITSKELKEVARIDFKFCKLDPRNQMEMFFTDLNLKEVEDSSCDISLLCSVVWPKRIPSWAATCQMVNNGNYPGQSNVEFLPMIDMNPSDASCIFSTIHFVCKEARKYQHIPVLTFDQPLYWKALTILRQEARDSIVKGVVLRLGAFHTEMTFLGVIGHLMSNSGLKELLETVYSETSVSHMLTGKAYSRAVRGHFLVQIALRTVILSQLYDFHLPTNDTNTSDTMESSDTTDSIEMTSGDNHDEVDVENKTKDIQGAVDAFDDLLTGKITCKDLQKNDALKNIREKMHLFEESHKEHKTALLWFQYLRLVEMLQRFITAERTGNWYLHLQTLKEMLPYFAATGHNNYTKSGHLYLQQMLQLENTHPTLHNAFINGHHVIRRSDRFWGGLSTDLVIEQVLMRSVKTTGGLTRGRGLTEEQRAKWLLSMPQCALINEAMQNITSTNYETSDQHKETGTTRKKRDDQDITCFTQFLRDRNPFSSEESLRNIETGVTGESRLNVYEAKLVGAKILESMNGSNVDEFVFKKKNQVVTLNSKSTVKVNENDIHVDPQLLFQRLVAASQNLLPDISELFTYELSGCPSSMFESSGLMRCAQKSQLADFIWTLGDCSGDILHDADISHILDGGSLLHRIPWSKGSTFQEIVDMYANVVQKFSNPTVVFDGYDGPSTKDSTHLRRTKGLVGTKILFSLQTPFRSKKESFLLNQENKQNFIAMLSRELKNRDIKTTQAKNDADVSIAEAAIEAASEHTTVVTGEDTDLLVLLIYMTDPTCQPIQFRSDQCRQSTPQKVWDIQKTRNVPGENICHLLPTLHALTGCDTTSRFFGVGKSNALKKLRESSRFQSLLSTLSKPMLSHAEVEKTGEGAISFLYGGLQYETLDTLRYRRFARKAISNSVSLLHINTLPPTSAAAKYHSFRSYYQAMEWMNKTAARLNPLEWGWELSCGGKMEPVKTHLPPAPEKLLQIIHCNCKGDCTSMRCTVYTRL